MISNAASKCITPPRAVCIEQILKSKGIDTRYWLPADQLEKIVLPEDKEELIKILKEKGLWDEMSMINFMRLNSGIIKGSLNNNEIKKMVDVVKDYRISLSKRRNMESEGEE